MIQIAGLGATSGTASSAITLTSANNVVRGLAIYNFTAAIVLFTQGASNNLIVGNFVGIDAAAAMPQPRFWRIRRGAGWS